MQICLEQNESNYQTGCRCRLDRGFWCKFFPDQISSGIPFGKALQQRNLSIGLYLSQTKQLLSSGGHKFSTSEKSIFSFIFHPE